MKVIDYSWARPSPVQIKQAGFDGVIRYLSYDTTGKNITASERDALRAAGLSITLNWENSAQDALGGSAAGVEYARQALAMANALGYPFVCALYFSVDFDATPQQQAVINAYFQAIESVIGHARTGAYGDYYVLERLAAAGLASYYWQTTAWSGGQIFGKDVIFQTGQQVFSGGADVDNISGPFGCWPAPGQPLPAPPPITTPSEDDDMWQSPPLTGIFDATGVNALTQQGKDAAGNQSDEKPMVTWVYVKALDAAGFKGEIVWTQASDGTPASTVPLDLVRGAHGKAPAPIPFDGGFSIVPAAGYEYARYSVACFRSAYA